MINSECQDVMLQTFRGKRVKIVESSSDPYPINSLFFFVRWFFCASK